MPLDLAEFGVTEGHGMTDPDVSELIPERIENVTGATSLDRNRFSVYVPHGKTVLSLGRAAVPQTSGERSWCINDPGITAATHEHIHFYVDDEAPGRAGDRKATLVSLGLKTKDLRTKVVGSVDTYASDQWKGYAMITEGAAIHESHENQYLQGHKDIILQAKAHTILHGTQGVFIKSDADGGGWDVWNVSEKVSREIGKANRAVVTTVAAGVGIVGSAFSIWYVPDTTNWGVPGFHPDALAKYKRAAQLALLGVRAYTIQDTWVDPNDGQGNIGIHAANKVMVTAPIAQVYGARAASLDSLVLSTVNGAAAAMVTGGLYASMTGGYQCTVQGLFHADLAALRGAARVRGREEVEVSSPARVAVTGGALVQVSSADQVQIHGANKGVWIGAGPLAGSAIEVQPQTISIGLSNHAVFGNSVFGGPKIVVGIDSIALSASPASLTLEMDAKQQKMTLEAGGTKLALSAVGAQVDGQRVMLG